MRLATKKPLAALETPKTGSESSYLAIERPERTTEWPYAATVEAKFLGLENAFKRCGLASERPLRVSELRALISHKEVLTCI